MLIERACEYCGATFQAARARAKYCSNAHRTAAYRRRRGGAPQAGAGVTDPVTPGRDSAAGPAPGSMEEATLAELTAAGRQGSALGLAVRVLAQRIDRGDVETGPGLAGLVREHAAALVRALDGGTEVDPFDELEARREQRRRDRAAAPGG